MPALRRRLAIAVLAGLIVAAYLLFSSDKAAQYSSRLPQFGAGDDAPPAFSLTDDRSSHDRVSVLQAEPVACRGADGKDIVPRSGLLGDHDVSFLRGPMAGSYHELGLDFTWITAANRYGPYGRSQDVDVDWKNVDWAALQNECTIRNALPDVEILSQQTSRKFREPNLDEQNWHGISKHTPPRPKATTGRTAILLRGWDTYNFRLDDFWRFRALISETSLRYGGKYTVYLLVDVGPLDVFSSDDEYERVLNILPAEFRSISVLFNQKMLRAWYPAVLEYGPTFQNEQPRQLFSHLFPEFDHYWQMELEVHFAGHAGQMLSALEEFARNEPRKQARERSSYTFISEQYKTYDNFTRAVNASLNGSSSFWEGVKIPDIEPIGPVPPGPAEDDDFSWGVGEDADLIVLGSVWNVTLDTTWRQRDWIYRFQQGSDTPRIASPGGASRCSWNLLNQMHDAQVWKALRLTSEASAPSFALWHNLKISRPPMPMFVHAGRKYSAEDYDIYYNGGAPSKDQSGMAWGEKFYGIMVGHNSPVNEPGLSWHGNDVYPRTMYKVWLENDIKNDQILQFVRHLPPLQYKDDAVYMPNLMFFPLKPLDEVITAFDGPTKEPA